MKMKKKLALLGELPPVLLPMLTGIGPPPVVIAASQVKNVVPEEFEVVIELYRRRKLLKVLLKPPSRITNSKSGSDFEDTPQQTRRSHLSSFA
jgi:hypothetical protein